MLERQVATSFVELLSDNTNTLSSIYSKFHSTFDIRNRMIALTGISMLLSDGLLEHSQQIVATWLLFNEFKNVPIHDSPFFPVLNHITNEVRLANPTFCPPQLYDIINYMLGKGDADFIGSMTLKSIMSDTFTLPSPPNNDLSAPKQYQPRISPILSEKVDNPENITMTPSQIIIELLSDSTIYNDFELLFVRPPPEITQIFPGEVQQTFISSYDTAPALFDEFASLNSKETAVELLKKATETQLGAPDVEILTKEIEKNPDLTSEANFSNQQINSLIEVNPSIAKEVILSLIKRNDQLLNYLASLPLTPAKAQVIQKVLVHPDLPPEQFEQFIYNTMERLKKIPSTDEDYTKSTSLFCRMLCAVYKEGKRFGADLLVELYSFSVQPQNEELPEAQELTQYLSAGE